MGVTTPHDDKGQQAPPDKSTVVLLVSIAADTTWRMFVPIIGATLLGVWADHGIRHIRPIGTIIGIVAGIAIATVLIRQQLQESEKKSEKKNDK